MRHAASQETLHDPKASSWSLVILIAANAMLALGPLFVRMADVGPVAAAFWRMAIALPIVALLARIVPHRRATWRAGMVGVIVISGLLFAADLASWHLGIVRTKMANATLFGNSASLIFPVYGFIVARAWPTRSQGIALALAAVGGALLMGRSAELSPEHLVGDLLSLLAGVFYAGYFIAMARVRQTLAPLPLLAASTLASATPLIIASWAMGEQVMPHDWTPLVLLALGSQVIGQGLMIYVLGKLSPLVIGLGLLTQPIVAAIVGWTVFSETLAAPDIAGAVLVGLALTLVRQPDRKSDYIAPPRPCDTMQ